MYTGLSNIFVSSQTFHQHPCQLEGWRDINVDVILSYVPETQPEYISEINAQLFPNGDLNLRSLLLNFESLGLPIQDKLVYYYSIPCALYYFCGSEHLERCAAIPQESIEYDGQRRIVRLRLRKNKV